MVGVRIRVAFSLVEVVIVVVIIGIVASIAMPRFSSAKENAIRRKVFADAHVLQRAVDRYVAEHEAESLGAGIVGSLCSLNGGFGNGCLEARTNYKGKTKDNGSFGPYVAVMPVNVLISPTAAKWYTDSYYSTDFSSVATNEDFGWFLDQDYSVAVITGYPFVEFLDGTIGKIGNLGDVSGGSLMGEEESGVDIADGSGSLDTNDGEDQSGATGGSGGGGGSHKP